MLNRSDAAFTRARQHELYEELWEHRSGEAYSPDLIRHRVWAPHLVGKIVDIGAGDGLLARSFPGHDIYSLDLTTAGLRRVTRRAVAASADELPLASGAFDTVVLSEVLEHVALPRSVLGECRRICRTGGTFLLSVPHWPLSATEALRHRRRTGSRPTLQNLRQWDPNHEHRFTRPELLDLLDQTGWQVRQVVPLFGEASSLGVYWLEPYLSRISKRDHRFAQNFASLDRWFGSRHSGLAVIASR